MSEDYKDVKIIIFDLWGTLLENGIFPSPARQTKKILGMFDTPFQEYIEAFEKAFMTQNFENLKEAFTHVFKTLNIDPKDFNREERLIGLWNKNKLFVRPYEDTIDVLTALQKKYKIILLTNSPFYTGEIIDKFKMGTFFDKMYLSCDTGMIKCEKASFDMVLKDFKVKPNEALMIGDSIESDMDGAKGADVRGILIDRRDKREFSPKVKSLTEIKKILLGKK